MIVYRHCFKSWINAMLLFSVLTFSACSWRLMYNYLDWILPWYLDDYVTLTDQQEELFDRTTIRFLDWHRSAELPRYADFFNSLKDAQDTPMSQDQVLSFFDEAENLWLALLAESLPDLLVLATQLTDIQVQQIDKALQTDSKELTEKYGKRTDEDQRQFWQEKMSEGLDNWLGYVNAGQQDLIRQWAIARINTTADWLAYRNDWRKRFTDLLSTRNQPNFEKEMRSFLLQPRNMYNNNYLQAVNTNRMSFAGLLAEISATLTDEQRNYLQKELAQIIIDLKDLSELEG